MNGNGNGIHSKLLTGAIAVLLSSLLTGAGIWLAFGASVITKTDARQMIEDRMSSTDAALERIDKKQDQLQESFDDMRERLARMEERLKSRERPSDAYGSAYQGR